MALVTIQRSPSPSIDPDSGTAGSSEDCIDGKPQMRKSLSQSYFTVKGAALILPHTEFTKKSARKSHGGEIQNHLQAMLHLLRPEDTIKIAIRLEDTNQYQRYMALVSTKGRQDTEEAVILGIDCNNTEASVGLVLPIWMGLRIKLGGDGGFSLCTDEQCYLFKPVSVQAMWSAIQSLVKVQHIADDMKYIPDGLTHTWIGYYRSVIDRRDTARLTQWNVEGVEVFAPSSLSIKSNESDTERIKLTISQTLKEVMMTVDLDEATSIMLRKAVEEKMKISLTEFKSYFDEEVMRILGQMDEPSEILEFLYLGSEWNASNLDELLEKGIGYILNVTKEIDNFFEDRFHYYNVRVYDVEEADLLKHWDKTYKFISKARSQKSKVLVHCKMGVSRSASTVMAFVMKDRRWSVEEAFKFVKEHRSCVHPNSGFMEQLHMYEGILTASNKREIFRSKSDQNLLDEDSEDTEPSEGSFLGDSLFRMMSHSDWQSAYGGVAHEEEWIGSLNKDQLPDLLQMNTDIETESRSADSMEEALPDMPSPTPETAGASQSLIHGFKTPLISVSQVSTRPLSEGSSLDTEMIDKPEVEAQVEKDLCSSDGTNVLLPSSGSALSSWIKPDSSWIKLETISTELENSDSQLLDTESVSSDDSFSNSKQNLCTLGTKITETNETLICQSKLIQSNMDTSEETKLIPAASVVPESLPYFSAPDLDASSPSIDNSLVDKARPHAQFYIGNVQNSLNISPAASPEVNSTGVIPEQLDSLSSCMSFDYIERKSSNFATVPCSQIVSSNLQDVSLKQKPVEQIPQQTSSEHQREAVEPVEYGDRILGKHEEIRNTEETDPNSASNITARSSQDINLDLCQCLIQENIPWKWGKVRKMQQDINKTGQILNEDEGNSERMKTDPSEIPRIQDESLGESDEVTSYGKNSGHQPSTTLCHSHSCLELYSQGEGDSALIPLYEREKIQLTPGIVLRTRLEIEERHKLIFGEGDQEVFRSTHPVLRTSSLRKERDMLRSRCTQVRRLSGPIMSPLNGKSLDDLPTAAVTEMRKIDFGYSIRPSLNQMKDTKVENELDYLTETDKMQSQKFHVTNSSAIPSTETLSSFPQNNQISYPTKDDNSPDDSKDKQLDTQDNGSLAQHMTKGNFDSETLALIREIGSALLMSPSPQKPDDADEDEPCTNMVKYLVRKIEKQTKIPNPPHNIIFTDTNNIKSISHENDESTKPLPTDVNVYPCPTPSAFQSVVSVKSRKPSDFTTQVVPGTSEVKINLSSQSAVHQDLSDTSCGQNSADPDSSITCSDMKPDSHQLPQTSGIMHNIAPTFLPMSKTVVKAAGTEQASSSSSQMMSSGHEPPEPSVVRHLVERFEIRSPESESGSSMFVHDCTHRFKDGHDCSSLSLSSCQKSLLEDSNVSRWSLEDSSNQTFASVSQLFSRPETSHVSSQQFSSSYDPAATSLVSSPLSSSTLSSHLSACNRRDTAQTSQLLTETDTSSLKDAPAVSTSFVESVLLNSGHSKLKSTDPFQRSYPEPESSSSNIFQRRNEREKLTNLTEPDDVSMRQVSSEGRKVRKLHGKSHPLTKLSEQRFGRGPFYSSM